MRQAMILAAGLGTRLKPLTDTMPKALVPVGGRPLLDIVIERLQHAGYHRFVVNIHHFAQQIRDHVAEKYRQDSVPAHQHDTPLCPHITFSDESDQLLETGGALKKAVPLFTTDDPILIHNVDIFDNVDYGWFSRQHLPDEDAVLLVSRRQTTRYLLFDSGMRLMGWINRATGEVRSPYPWLRQADITLDDNLLAHLSSGSSNHISHLSPLTSHFPLYAFAFSGIHSFSPRLFPLMERFPDRFSIIDFYLSVCHRARIVGCAKDDLRLLDVGKIDSLGEAEKFLANF